MCVGQILQFRVFRLGIDALLLVLSFGVSGTDVATKEHAPRRERRSAVDVTRWLARQKTAVNRVAGSLMLLLSLFFLTCKFHVFGIDLALCDLFIG